MSMPIQRQSEQFSVFDTGTRWERDRPQHELPRGLAGLVNSMGPRITGGMLNTRTAGTDSYPTPEHLWEGQGPSHDENGRHLRNSTPSEVEHFRDVARALREHHHIGGWHHPDRRDWTDYDPADDFYDDRPSRADFAEEEAELARKRNYPRGQGPAWNYSEDGDPDPDLESLENTADPERFISGSRRRLAVEEDYSGGDEDDPDWIRENSPRQQEHNRKRGEEIRHSKEMFGSRRPFDRAAGRRQAAQEPVEPWMDPEKFIKYHNDYFGKESDPTTQDNIRGMSDHELHSYWKDLENARDKTPEQMHQDREQSRAKAKELADQLWNAFYPPEEEEGRKAVRNIDTVNNLIASGWQPEHIKYDEEDEPYALYQHPSGWTVKDSGSNYKEIGHAATPDEYHDVINVSRYDRDSGESYNDVFGPADAHAFIENQLHGDPEETGGTLQYLMQNHPAIRRHRPRQAAIGEWVEPNDDPESPHYRNRDYAGIWSGMAPGWGTLPGYMISQMPEYRMPDEGLPTKARMNSRQAAKGGGCTCWEGYERVPGTEPCADGSCRKKTKKKESHRGAGKGTDWSQARPGPWFDEPLYKQDPHDPFNWLPYDGPVCPVCNRFTKLLPKPGCREHHASHTAGVTIEAGLMDEIRGRGIQEPMPWEETDQGWQHPKTRVQVVPHDRTPDLWRMMSPAVTMGGRKTRYIQTLVHADPQVLMDYHDWEIGGPSPSWHGQPKWHHRVISPNLPQFTAQMSYEDAMKYIDETLAAGEPEDKSDYSTDYYSEGHPEVLNPEVERYEGPPFPGARCDHCDRNYDQPFQVNHVSVGDDYKGKFCDDCLDGLIPSWANRASQPDEYHHTGHSRRQAGRPGWVTNNPRTAAEVAQDPAAIAPQIPAGGGYQIAHRVGLPWRDRLIPGTVIGLDGPNVAVRWDDGQYSTEEPHNIQLL